MFLKASARRPAVRYAEGRTLTSAMATRLDVRHTAACETPSQVDDVRARASASKLLGLELPCC